MESAPETVGEAWLRLLKARGVDFLFANAGTDFPSIVEGIARAEQNGIDIPRPIICGHENAAVSMAHGHAMVSGKAQAAMVHVNVGTANSINGLINADRDYVPLLLAAGRTPFLEEGEAGARSLNIHWAQEMFDQAGMVRESVRWDYELKDPRQLEAATDRALAIAHSSPAGPVYMTLPRELLAMKPASETISAVPLMLPAGPGAPDPADVQAAADALSKARFPVIVTARAGADKAVPALLSRFAAATGAPVVEYRPRHLSLSSEDAFHGGFEIAPWIADADLIVVLECDVPWMPATDRTADGLKVIQVGIDPLQARYPLRGFRSDLTIRASAKLFLEAMLDELSDTKAPAERSATVSARCAAMRDKGRASASQMPREITMAWASACLDRARAPGSILVNEYPLVRWVMTTTEPGEFYGSSPAGGLGWGLPAALGAKLAAPEREVIAAVGDGSHIFANPIACHQIAAAENIPILVMIFNNAGWGAVARATRAMYPDGHAARANRMPLTRFEPVPEFATIAQACGCWGETVEDPALLPSALDRAFSEIRENGRCAVLDVRCAG
ncbi:thiamine pyrophosphate-requiring protein [Mesorhizobium sp. CAU 1732]|uniref:thiamine pyrophosphate-requiring protein n=1 Tax=Mesorhizobium sp. CAU 1732 TaxID=3140358 RepID=UPI003260AD79